MDSQEIESALRALRAWFESQSFMPIDAAFIAATFSGEVAGLLANDARHLEAGVGLLWETLKRSSKIALETR